MAMHPSEALWQEFQRLAVRQETARLVQRQLFFDTAQQLDNQFTIEQEIVKRIFQQVLPEDIKSELAVMVNVSYIQRAIYNNLLQNTPNASVNNNSENKDEKENIMSNMMEYAKSESFINWIKNDGAFKQLRDYALQEVQEEPEACKRVESEVSKSIRETKESILEPKSHQQERTWKDLPSDELAERLSKGEICPREEWIPGVSKGKRPLTEKEFQEHIRFGEKVLAEGREAYHQKEYNLAHIRFKQVVEMFNWVQSEDKDSNLEITEKLKVALNNTALAALKLEQYQDCIRATTQVIQEIDSEDAKARYHRGQAYMMLGMAKSAKDDFVYLLKSPFSGDDDVKCARYGLQKLRDIVCASAKTNARLIKQSVEKDVFACDRASGNSSMINGYPVDDKMEDIDDLKELYSQQKGDSNKSTLQKQPENLLPKEKTYDILVDLLEVYTDSEISKKLAAAQTAADYDMRRTVIRVGKILPPLQAEIFQRHGLIEGPTHRSNLSRFQTSVNYWRKLDEEIDTLATDCLDAIFGDTMHT